ncbi:hypothetical protein GALMADRAFT_282207 [Galerina marginata CBS 339.88]|uniref:Xaa-Pro dipeptidyl-peptidase-like domain-containing protein n=1 Tax=Galerina marginata (strain CBS 339.88) TaxID=685588 RepID=A0A067SUM3_GALM3|nr:hypothetical protein GALMADRAFT_282207 [Galerina marginata CBS 339.88]
MTFSKQTLQITSVEDAVSLDVWVYKPSTEPPYPVVVAGHGLTATKEAGMASFGERWAIDAGFASVIFDYRYFGKSGGEPRNLVDFDKQLEDFRSVVEWVRRQDIFLDTKIVVMGSAIAALNATRLALEDPAIAGVMVHSPVLDGFATVLAAGFNPWLIFWAIVDKIRSILGLSPLLIRAVGKGNEFAFLNSPSSYAGFVDMYKDSPVSFSDTPNLLSPSFVFQMVGIRPGLQLKNAKFPLLLVSPQHDDISPVSISKDIAREAPGNVTFVECQGGHFDVMPGGKGFETNIAAQVEFLRTIKG